MMKTGSFNNVQRDMVATSGPLAQIIHSRPRRRIMKWPALVAPTRHKEHETSHVQNQHKHRIPHKAKKAVLSTHRQKRDGPDDFLQFRCRVQEPKELTLPLHEIRYYKNTEITLPMLQSVAWLLKFSVSAVIVVRCIIMYFMETLDHRSTELLSILILR